jgi:predicted small lipoprotein YifL
MRALRTGLIAAGAALLTSGCGQKGPLYLPDKGAAVVTSAPAAAQGQPAAPAASPPAPATPAAPKPRDKDKDKDQDSPPPKP